MRDHPSRAARAAALCASVAAVAVLAVPAQGAVGVVPRVAPAFAATGGRVVLPTGDSVLLSPAGAQVQPGGPSQAFSTFTTPAGDTYLVPAEAVPYAGRQLDLSLFDVTKLATIAAATPNGQIPVSLVFAAGVAPSAPAGVTLTGVSGQTATGYLTPASGAAFAAALRQQIAADKAAGRTVGSGGLSGLASMRLAGTGTPVTPNYPLRILQINALGDDGKPIDGYVTLVDTDDSRVLTLSVPVLDGVARVAIPAGNYSAYMNNYSFDSVGDITGDELVAANDFAVPAAGDVPALTLDSRTATAPVSVTTPLPATPEDSAERVIRTPANGPAVAVGAFTVFTGAVPVKVSPQPKAKVGQFVLDTFVHSVSPAAADQTSDPYQFLLDFEADDIGTDQSHHPTTGDLAAETENIDSDPIFAGRTHSVGAAPMLAADAPSFQFGIQMPRKSTIYLTPGRWVTGVAGPWATAPSQPQGPTLSSGAKTYRAGLVTAHTWGKAPDAPGFARYPEAAAEQDCQACVGAGTMDLEFYESGDSNPDTIGVDFDATSTATFYWNGQPLPPPSGPFPRPAVIVPNVGTAPATVRAVLDSSHPAGEKQSTNTHTDVTFQYTGKTDPWSALPAGNYCPAATAAGQPSAPCQIMPVLTIGYQYNGLSTTNVSHGPVQSLVLDIGHHSFGGHGSHAPVVSAHVSVSFDGGATWQNVPTAGADGHYAALWHNPAVGTPVTVRVTASDAIGGTITQTVANPYTVG